MVVVSSDDAPGATTDGETPKTDGSNLPKMSYHKVTVEVTDVDEDGSVSLSTLQPQVGVELTATLTDQDARSGNDPIINSTWKWEQSPAMDGPWIVIVGATAAAYDPVAGVVAKYLRATVTYTDEHGADKTAMAVSAHAVRAEPAGTNSSPVFPGESTARNVKENSPPGTNVGKPVAAGDAGDILSYTLTLGEDLADQYAIDRATGQITVGPRAMLNREDTVNGSNFQHTVTVTATDPWGIVDDNDERGAPSVDTTEVTITIDNVNEAPMINMGPTRMDHAENTDIATLNGAYGATDVDDGDAALTWSLEGEDAAKFNIGEADGMLTFEKAPNFESPADADMDNIYIVTVVATDAKKLTAMRDVVITVTNAKEAGTITLSSVQPKVGRPFTASLTDPDSVTSTNSDGSIETGVTWQWWRTTLITDQPAPTFPGDADWEEIADTKSDTYKPVSDDEERWLTAMATYTDRRGPGNTMHESSDNAVIQNTDNVAPEFREGGDKPVMQATRYIMESADADANVVVNPDGSTPSTDDSNPDMVTATDSNTIDLLTYTLSGPDKDSFEIDALSGQITVGADTKLDYESSKKTYRVTLTATDPSRAMTTIDVTIKVTDSDEAPEFTGSFAEDEPFTRTIREESTNLRVATLTAVSRDKGQPKVYWSLLPRDGNADYPDGEYFQIDGNGVLSFKSSPDHENPRGMALTEDNTNTNTYKVIVVASDNALGADGTGGSVSGEMAQKKVELTVTEVEETGKVTLSARRAQVDIEITATLTDDDLTEELFNAADWQWYQGNSGTVVAEGNGNPGAAFTPHANDVGTVRAEATYTDAGGEFRTVRKSVIVQAKPTDQDDTPTFPSGSDTRTVKENMSAGTNVGRPVTATDDDNADNSWLTYTLTGGDGNFEINPANGQLTTTRLLNSEGTTETEGEGASHTVVVTATDPGNMGGTQSVIITVQNVNEAPMVATGFTRVDYAEKLGADALDTVATYTASDPETTDSDELTWSLAGSDKDDFHIGNQDGGTPGILAFREKPDFEKPVDSNRDNVYMVTVQVSDGNLPGTRAMDVTVTDVDENGEVTLSAVQPKVGIDLTASLTDPDSVTSTNSDGSIETGVTWQWWRTTLITDQPAPTFPGDADWEEIADTKSDTYKPVSDDEERWLTAMATYTDRRGPGNTMHESSDNAVIQNTDNVAPEFREGGDKPVMQATRYIMESADADANVVVNPDGSPPSTDNSNPDMVTATDSNTIDLLTYTLSGPDRALFKITSVRDTGQLQTKAKLNYEDKNTYMVTVTATDPNGLSPTPST